MRQPVHTMYGGAHRFRADVAQRLGLHALRSLEAYAPNASELARAIGDPGDVVGEVYERVRDRLTREPVEDYRVDFEDGYGARADDEEDAHARSVASAFALGMRDHLLPRFIGIRVKPFSGAWKERSERTLRLFLRAVCEHTGGIVPDGLRLTLPKVEGAQEANEFASLLDALERELGLVHRSLSFEIMVETPRLIMDADGRCPLLSVVRAGEGRITAAHFGTYDYSAALGIAAQHQRMRHDACQHALRVMQVALAGTGVWLSDGATTHLPVPIHRATATSALSREQLAENARHVHAAWQLHYEDVRHSLANGFYQGWDLHPAQLVTRYAALFTFFREGLDEAAARLRNFVAQSAQATRVGDVFDDAATARGLANYFIRALNAGAVDESELAARTGFKGSELLKPEDVSAASRRST